MDKIFVFAGTSEGRRLAKRLGAAGVLTMVSVATEYGAMVLEEAGLGQSVKVLRGRMTPEEMEKAIRDFDPMVVVDATHPYALAASANIRSATGAAGVPYLRLKRKTQDAPSRKVFLFETAGEVIESLKRTHGNILLTTGVNLLPEFAADEELRERLFVRVLPGRESLEACEAAGIRGRQIIAMQGPFSQEMNRATIHAYDIKHLVTKQSGRSGGFEEKIFAAQETETAVYILGAPEEEGIPYAVVLDRLGEMLGIDLRETITITVSMVGVGPGSERFLTEEARTTIAEADVLFGAERMVEPYAQGKQVFPYYKGEDIVPRLESLLREAREKDPHVRVAILLSGDSGFYSGSSGLLFYFTNWRRRISLSDTGHFTMQIRTIPGISSVQMLAARLQDHWEAAYIDSLHGTNEEAFDRVVQRIPWEKWTFLLTSGVADVYRLLRWVREQGDKRENYSLYAGYRLSYPDEIIFGEEGLRPGNGTEDAKLSPFPDILPEGLYTVMIRNSDPEEGTGEQAVLQTTLGLSNDAFLKEPGTPITKEEIRTIAISKLRISEPAVVYDIGGGTGSFAVEMGRVLRNSRIFTIEKDKDRVEVIRRNVKHLQASSVTVVEGEAPEILSTLTPPTHAVIGGADGRLLSILTTLFNLSPHCAVVVMASTLETKAEIASLLSGQIVTDYELLNAEYIELNVSRSRQLGKYRALKAENPVAILSFRFGRKPGA